MRLSLWPSASGQHTAPRFGRRSAFPSPSSSPPRLAYRFRTATCAQQSRPIYILIVHYGSSDLTPRAVTSQKNGLVPPVPRVPGGSAPPHATWKRTRAAACLAAPGGERKRFAGLRGLANSASNSVDRATSAEFSVCLCCRQDGTERPPYQCEKKRHRRRSPTPPPPHTNPITTGHSTPCKLKYL